MLLEVVEDDAGELDDELVDDEEAPPSDDEDEPLPAVEVDDFEPRESVR